ncbi:MAG: hypothetical protein M0P12_10560 [Paludibacteraceae bacterium]|nr:hypothetical protein [Paludibacteraceae bacterium]
MKKLILVLMLLLGFKMSAVAETNGTEIFYNYGSIVTNLMDFSYLSYTNVFCGSFYVRPTITA